jgi:hypothetical protein
MFTTFDMHEARARREIRSQFLVEGLIHRTATMVIGQPMSGKSFLTVSLAASLVQDQTSWLGQVVHRRGLSVAFGLTDPGAADETVDRIHSLTGDTERVRFAELRNNGRPEFWHGVKHNLMDNGIGVFVLDNVIGAMPPGGEVNHLADARALTDGLGLLIDAGMSVVAVHHTAKASGQGGPGRTAMGSQHFTAWARSIIRVDQARGEQRRLSVSGNNAEGRNLFVAPRVSDQGAITYDVASDELESVRQTRRSTQRLDHNATVARWVVEHCQGYTQKATADALALQFGGQSTTAVGYLSGRRAYGAMLERSGTSWVLAEG